MEQQQGTDVGPRPQRRQKSDGGEAGQDHRGYKEQQENALRLVFDRERAEQQSADGGGASGTNNRCDGALTGASQAKGQAKGDGDRGGDGDSAGDAAGARNRTNDGNAKSNGAAPTEPKANVRAAAPATAAKAITASTPAASSMPKAVAAYPQTIDFRPFSRKKLHIAKPSNAATAATKPLDQPGTFGFRPSAVSAGPT